jgi:hypothetical protein
MGCAQGDQAQEPTHAFIFLSRRTEISLGRDSDIGVGVELGFATFAG